MDINGKIAAVFGGASGIGLAIVKELLARDIKGVVIFYLPSETTEDGVAKLESQFDKNRVLLIPCDITKQDEVNAGFKKMLTTFGTLDILVNSAGICDEVNWEKTLSVNLGGIIRSSLAAIHVMGKHNGGKGGTIVNIASVAGVTYCPWVPTYTTTKFGVVAYSAALQGNFDKTGVRVLTICPNWTTTPLTLKSRGGVRNVDYIDYDKFLLHLDAEIWQSPEFVAEGTADLIEKGKGGAVLVIEKCQPPYLVEPSVYPDLPKTPL